MLEWEAEWLEHADKLQRLVKQGIKVAALERRPRPDTYLIQYWNAYQTLSGARSHSVGLSGMLPLPINYADIGAYATLHGWEGDDAAELAFFVRALDNHYLTLRFTVKPGRGTSRGTAPG